MVFFFFGFAICIYVKRLKENVLTFVLYFFSTKCEKKCLVSIQALSHKWIVIVKTICYELCNFEIAMHYSNFWWNLRFSTASTWLAYDYMVTCLRRFFCFDRPYYFTSAIWGLVNRNTASGNFLKNWANYTTAPDGYSRINFTYKQKIEIFCQMPCFYWRSPIWAKNPLELKEALILSI